MVLRLRCNLLMTPTCKYSTSIHSIGHLYLRGVHGSLYFCIPAFFLEHSEIEWLFSCFGILPPFYKWENRTLKMLQLQGQNVCYSLRICDWLLFSWRPLDAVLSKFPDMRTSFTVSMGLQTVISPNSLTVTCRILHAKLVSWNCSIGLFWD